MRENFTLINSPLGELLLHGRDGRLRGLRFQGEGSRRGPLAIDPAWQRDDAAFTDARTQLERYFAGQLLEFELELELQGSDWERSVWAALRRIPHGQTRSYGELAGQLCTPQAARAVGVANGRNPVAIIVPCHRVIGAGGKLTGYGGGLERKRALLDLEAGRGALLV